MRVSEWADRERRLSSEASGEPGQWVTARAEYLRGIMDAIHEPEIETVVVMSAAQAGKTEGLLNTIGYHIEQDPSPMLLLQPTLEMAQAFSKDRVAPMLRDTPALKGLVKDARARDSGNTLLHKQFPGGHITMAGANAPASLASRPVRIVLCDEVDRYPVSAGTEGDPVSLARKRTANFWNRKVILTSTPTVRGLSRIENAYEDSDKRQFLVPCPDCGHEQPLLWAQVTWPKNEDGESQRDKAAYACGECGVLWGDGERWRAIARGRWEARAKSQGVAGFHLSALYSPWQRLAEIAIEHGQVKNHPEQLKTWVNTVLGETWEEEGERVDDIGLMGRREEFSAEVPESAVVLTAGVDVQDDRLEMEVVGWADGEESWSVGEHILHGDPRQARVWEDLDALLLDTWLHESGVQLQIAAAAIDSGYLTDEVYDFCRTRRGRRVYAVKGRSGASRPVVGPPTDAKDRKGRKIKLWTVGVDSAKDLIYARLRKTTDAEDRGGAGYCHFPTERGEEFFAQLTAEQKITKYRRGFPYEVWEKIRPRNEALDRRVYALAAVRILNPRYSALRPQPKKAKAPKQADPTVTERQVEAHRKAVREHQRRRRRARSWK